MRSLMKGEFWNASFFVKLAVVVLFIIDVVFLTRNWVGSSEHQETIPPSAAPSFSGFVPANIILEDVRYQIGSPSPAPNQAPAPTPVPSDIFGLLDENGTMTDQFQVGDLADDEEEDLESDAVEKVEERAIPKVVDKYPRCPDSMQNYIPCIDNEEALAKLDSTQRRERFERHCPANDSFPKCVVPQPANYRSKIPWPKSRDQVWYSNVADSQLMQSKEGSVWVVQKKRKLTFPDNGVNKYLDQISGMAPEIGFGSHTRVVLDVGCGVASFAAYLFPRDVITLSIAPKDTYGNQIQLALERGVPAMVEALATHRLVYPSQAFDMIHCSTCQVNWTLNDGVLLLEANRLLRAGGFFVWATAKRDNNFRISQKEMKNLAAALCWELVEKENKILIWKKPQNNSCYLNRTSGAQPPLCTDDDPDDVWYVDLKACISLLPENGIGGNTPAWPNRLHAPPDRLKIITMDSYIARTEHYQADTKYWHEVADGYIRAFHWKKLKFRNIMDMRTKFGGLGAALVDHQLGSWMMNVVPISEPNTLPVIYDRGLVGVIHDWCEPFDTYPRTYDLLHATELFSREQKRCDISRIVLEMDRILRPGGYAYIRDTKKVAEEVQQIASAVGWRVTMYDPSEGPFSSWRLLRCEKPRMSNLSKLI